MPAVRIAIATLFALLYSCLRLWLDIVDVAGGAVKPNCFCSGTSFALCGGR
jgi:hypothetical protein